MAVKYAILLVILSCFFTGETTATRVVPLPVQLGRHSHLTARLEADGSLADCWAALTEIKSCANEIVLFFMNGETRIEQPCCRAITTITHHCWPAMLTALGFTSEEYNVLRGYCDASGSGPAPRPVAVQPPPPAKNTMV